MLRHLTLCVTVAAALQTQPAVAAPASEDAPVPVSAADAARRLGLDLVRDRARFVPELARLLHGTPVGQQPPFDPLVEPEAGAPALAPVLVPVPLSADLWSQAVFRRQVTTADLIEAIMADREAALLARGLAGLDDETLEFLADASDLVALLYERGAAAFAAFGASLFIRADRIVPPGGAAAEPLWEAVVGERVRDARRFVAALFTRSRGRLAYLYDIIAALDPPRAAFALGTWIADADVRRERFRALATLCVRSYPDWRLEATPFVRPPNDLSFMLMRVRVGPSGAPAPPASRAFWREAFDSSSLTLTDRQLSGLDDDTSEPIDAAWLAEIATGDLFGRGDRLDQFAYGQRAFARASAQARADALVAVRAFPRQRMLLLTLERMGIRAPEVLATAARQAARLAVGDASRTFWRLAQVQSALAILARLHAGGTIDTSTAESLVTSLLGVAVDEGRYRGAIAGWIEEELAPHLPEGETIDDRITAGLGGPAPADAAPRVAWEGQEYLLDFAQAETRRLRAVRDRQGGLPLALAVDLNRNARRLRASTLTTAALDEIVIALSAIADTFHAAPNGAVADSLPPGVGRPRDGPRALADAVREAERLARGGEARRAARLAPPLLEVVDEVAGTALLSLAYAVHLGAPDGAPLLADNVALRHDFGFSHPDAEMRARTPWAVPRQNVQPGVPWHVSGSVLGLNIALAPLVLRRIRLDRVADVPRLRSTAREAFSVSVALMEPGTLCDADRDFIAAAVARGRARVDALADGEEDLATITGVLGLDGWRQRAIDWTVDHEPARLPSAFSLVELLALGGAAERDLSAWGATGLHLEGCACSRMVAPRHWRLLAGRPQSPFLVLALADLNLRVALSLAELGLPAALARPVLAAAVQDFIDEAGPSDYNDWLTLARAAQALSLERIEDYVASAAAVDGPLVPIAESLASQP